MARLKILLFFLIVANAHGSNEKLIKSFTYNVVKNDVVIGTIEINQSIVGDSIIYLLESDIKAKFILNYNITGLEKTIYKDDVLVYSSVYRTLNNKVQANHNISYTTEGYRLHAFGKVSLLNLKAIVQNLVLLYFKEPKNVEAVYCDNLSRMLKVKSLGNGLYRVDFEKGKYNIFHYQNGTCVKIEANSSLFSITIIPAQS